MQKLRPRLRPTQSESSFWKFPLLFKCTLKFKKHVADVIWGPSLVNKCKEVICKKIILKSKLLVDAKKLNERQPALYHHKTYHYHQMVSHFPLLDIWEDCGFLPLKACDQPSTCAHWLCMEVSFVVPENVIASAKSLILHHPKPLNHYDMQSLPDDLG